MGDLSVTLGDLADIIFEDNSDFSSEFTKLHFTDAPITVVVGADLPSVGA